MLSACAARPVKPLATVPRVELPRYMGKWHEVARLPMYFQNGCVSSTAEYELREDGTVSVVNRCLKDGQPKMVRGTATVVDARTQAVLEVRFSEWFSAFIPRAREGNYFIIWLAEDYSAAAVGLPSRNCLWILSRSPRLPAAVYERIVAHCRSQGFPVERVIVEPAQQAVLRMR